jgi:methyl-accepting chemotaxis protein
MELEKGPFYDLPERIAQDFNELDSNICRDLSGVNEEYASLRKRSLEISERYPVIEQVLEDAGAISLTAEEHAALVEHMNLAIELENLERLHIYFRGHTDCFSYLKRIGAI